jgi:hypothetical protein
MIKPQHIGAQRTTTGRPYTFSVNYGNMKVVLKVKYGSVWSENGAKNEKKVA